MKYHNLSLTLLMLLLPCLIRCDMIPSSLSYFYSRTDILHRHQYKHSFCAPKLTIGTESRIAFWRYGGDAIATQDSLRIVPSIRSRQGFVWNEEKLKLSDWEIDMSFRVTGRLRQGADGMAVWLTEEQTTRGSTFGSGDMWKGIGIIMDSFDNDGLKDNPKIQLVANDGTRHYNHHLDGKSDELASCLKDYRNQPYVVRLKIIKVESTMQVWVHSGYSQSPSYADYDLCIQSVLPPDMIAEGYLGITAATGGLSDDHDVICFTLHSLVQKEAGPMSEAGSNITSSEEAFRTKIDEEYDKFNQEFSVKRSKYQQEHPDTMDEYDLDDFETNVESKLKLLLERQGAMMKEILSAKVSGGSSGIGESQLNTIAQDLKNLEHRISDLKLDSGRMRGPEINSESQGAMHEVKKEVQGLHSSLADLRGTIDRKITELIVKFNEEPRRAAERSESSGLGAGTCSGCIGFWTMVMFVTVQVLLVSCLILGAKLREHRSKKYF